MAITSVEVADIVRSGLEQFEQSYPLRAEQRQALRAIVNCRTSAYGGHLYECDSCQHRHPAYNSCRNRHCPKCQTLAKERWLEHRQAELLPVGYFHIVFTIPDTLRPLFRGNPRVLYDLLFRSASRTIVQIGLDPARLGARVGVLAILHTWSQTLTYHPHVHCIVPGGGLTVEGDGWLPCRRNYFAPVKVMGQLFRGKMLSGLKRRWQSLTFGGPLRSLACRSAFERLLAPLYETDWIVYCQPPFGSARRVLSYLARYTHRVAISNDRVERFDQDQVTIRYRDSRSNRRIRRLRLTTTEFLSRFVSHVLPRGFVRIRSYGLLANRCRKVCLAQCRIALRARRPKERPETTWQQLYQQLTGRDPLQCPRCSKGTLRPMGALSRAGPPP